jgi:prepilin signal peptidase PulO-like enzyme (type II secretory pathway)
MINDLLSPHILPYLPIVIAIIGLCVGSFITMASYRLPLEQGIVVKPSHCPACNHSLGFRDLFPVFSWLLSRGKCRYCSTAISVRYPLIEITTAITFLGIYLHFSISPFSLILMGMAIGILIMIVTDLEHYIIPDGIQWWLAILAIVHAWLMQLHWQPLVIGSIAGFVFGYILCVGYPKIRGIEGLGFGDVKFFAVAGLWLGWFNLVPFFVCSGFLGVILAIIWRALGRGKYFPFGPALGLSLFLFVAFPEIPHYFWRELHTLLLQESST